MQNLQGWSTLNAEFTMEDEDVLFLAIPTSAWLGFVGTQQVLLDSLSSIEIDGARNVSPFILVVESAVDHRIRVDLMVEMTCQEVVEL